MGFFSSIISSLMSGSYSGRRRRSHYGHGHYQRTRRSSFLSSFSIFSRSFSSSRKHRRRRYSRSSSWWS